MIKFTFKITLRKQEYPVIVSTVQEDSNSAVEFLFRSFKTIVKLEVVEKKVGSVEEFSKEMPKGNILYRTTLECRNEKCSAFDNLKENNCARFMSSVLVIECKNRRKR